MSQSIHRPWCRITPTNFLGRGQCHHLPYRNPIDERVGSLTARATTEKACFAFEGSQINAHLSFDQSPPAAGARPICPTPLPPPLPRPPPPPLPPRHPKPPRPPVSKLRSLSSTFARSFSSPSHSLCRSSSDPMAFRSKSISLSPTAFHRRLHQSPYTRGPRL